MCQPKQNSLPFNIQKLKTSVKALVCIEHQYNLQQTSKSNGSLQNNLTLNP